MKKSSYLLELNEACSVFVEKTILCKRKRQYQLKGAIALGILSEKKGLANHSLDEELEPTVEKRAVELGGHGAHTLPKSACVEKYPFPWGGRFNRREKSG